MYMTQMTPRRRTCAAALMRARWLVLVAALAGAAGCRDLAGTQALPAGTSDPANFRTPEGALDLYRGAAGLFQDTFATFLARSGMLADELSSSSNSTLSAIDARTLPDAGENGNAFLEGSGPLQRVRAQTATAIAALAQYNPSAPTALRGELYALEGYSEVMLADLFCSGIPLSTVDFEQDFTYKPGSTTAQVYQHAVALFDTAIVLSAADPRILNLARVGKARA